MKDKANFYKLSKEEQENIENLWEDASPDVKTFADNLTEEIKSSDTPFVLGIDGGYGTGKTYFATRFSEHLKRNNINTIYCSVWENDYLENPFIAISKEIVKYTKNNNLTEKIKKLFTSICNGVSISVGIPKVGDISINPSDIIKSWQDEKNEIIEFKKAFANFIDKLTNKKLVLIIDELDRCKPDFAVKTLEILKHFFDIEGLFVILMINKSRLEEHINAYYNIQKDNKNGEEYLQKFINRYEHIPNMNYEVVINDSLTVDSLKPAIDNGNITQDDGVFYSFKELKNYLITACSDARLTYRESQELCQKCIDFCNNYNELIRCRFLPYILIKDRLTDKIIFKDCKKYITEKKQEIIGLLNRGYFTGAPSLPIWSVIENKYKSLTYIDDWGEEKLISTMLRETYDRITEIYNELKLYGPDDNDEERLQKYETIAKDFNKLYEK
ncbi:hypothetical protein HDR60_04820 [bacterium]|nr:hypothetical protein [bacterium]